MDQRILIKLDEHEQILSELRGILPGTPQEYTNAPIIRRAVERLIQVSIECVVDICAALLKFLRLGVPKSEEDVFTKLEKNVFTPELIEKLRAMKRFRNRIVHRYGDLDDVQIYEIIQNSFIDFVEFGEELRNFLKSER